MSWIPVVGRAAPPRPAAEQPAEDHEHTVEMAIEAWRSGEWTEVRDLLEPVLREGNGIDDPLLLEAGLRYLADATLYDEGLTPEEREKLARGYIGRMLDASSVWEPPSGLHGSAFYELAAKVRSERDSMHSAACKDQLLSCEADLAELRVDHQSIIRQADELQRDLDDKKVYRANVVQRNRGLAVIPLGIGHFTNGNRATARGRLSFALGGAFLTAEVVFGGVGLGLLIYRNTALNCTRTKGFQPGSLDCPFDGPVSETNDRRAFAKSIRDAEQGMAIAFLGAVVLDIILAQSLFRDTEVVDGEWVPRSELDAPATKPTRRRGQPRKPGGQVAPSPDETAADRARARFDPTPSLRVRPAPTYLRGGAGFGVRLDF